MNPAYSVILFTTASGAGYGLLALLGLVGFNHGPVSNFAFGLVAVVVALGLITVGLLSSTFHLGHPERAWRAFSQWKSSWLSREGVASVVTYIPAVLFGATWLDIVHAPALIGPLGIVTAIMCAITVFCTAKIYSTLKTIRAWNHPLVVPVYLAFAVTSGGALLTALATIFGRFQFFQVILTVVALLWLIGLKFFYWRAIDNAARTHSMAAATGLGTSVRQWEVPHTSENYIMKEMGFRRCPQTRIEAAQRSVRSFLHHSAGACRVYSVALVFTRCCAGYLSRRCGGALAVLRRSPACGIALLWSGKSLTCLHRAFAGLMTGLRSKPSHLAFMPLASRAFIGSTGVT